MQRSTDSRWNEGDRALLDAMEASLGIKDRRQFFRWSQGPLQSLIPHDLLMCSYQLGGKNKTGLEVFSSSPLSKTDREELATAKDSLLSGLRHTWNLRRHTPLVLGRNSNDHETSPDLRPLLSRHKVNTCVVHGMPSAQGAGQSFFCFARTPVALSQSHATTLGLLLPCMHLALLRVAASEPSLQRLVSRSCDVMTMRESQVLHGMRDGRSNREIGELLGISALTAKNHVHNILKKLSAQNRAQAVSHAISKGLIQPRQDYTGPASEASDSTL